MTRIYAKSCGVPLTDGTLQQALVRIQGLRAHALPGKSVFGSSQRESRRIYPILAIGVLLREVQAAGVT